MEKNYYDILGVSMNATEDEIKAAYRTKSKKLHPDICGDDGLFKDINEANQTLSNEQKRKEYDEKLRTNKGISNFNFFYNQCDNRNQQNDNMRSITLRINELRKQIKEIERNVLDIKRQIKHVEHNKYNMELGEINQERSEEITAISSRMTYERNRKRFISTFFPNIDRKIIVKYESQIQMVNKVADEKISSLNTSWEERLKREDDYNKEKTDKMSMLLSSKDSLEGKINKLLQDIYGNNHTTNLQKGKK